MKLRKDIRARRMSVCSTASISVSAPIEATPTTTVEKKNPGRTQSTDRRIIADVRRINLGFPEYQYYPVRVPSVETLARLLAPMTVAFPGLIIEMAKRDIASSFRLLRLHPALALIMGTELPGAHFGYNHDIVFFYLAMPFGWNGAPENFALFGDAISAIRSRFGMGDPSWRTTSPFLSFVYVDDGMFFDIRNSTRQQANTATWERITKGVLGNDAINNEKLDLEGSWRTEHTLIGFDVNSYYLTIKLPQAKIHGATA